MSTGRYDSRQPAFVREGGFGVWQRTGVCNPLALRALGAGTIEGAANQVHKCTSMTEMLL